MAIQPISTYRGNDNNLLQILQSSNSAITGIFDRAIQIGRDISDKRTHQESDMLAMRAQERALAQRGASELQQNISDAQRISRNNYEFDVKFGADQERDAFNQNRSVVNDMFTQNRAIENDTRQQANADRVFDFQKQQSEFRQSDADRDFKLKEGEFAQKQEDRRILRDQITQLYGAPSESNSLTAEVNVPGMFGTEPAKKPAGSKFQAAVEILSNPSAPPQARAQAQKIFDSGKGAASLTPYQQERLRLSEAANARAQEAHEKRMSDPTSSARPNSAENKILVEQNLSAFPHSASYLIKQKESGATLTPDQDRELERSNDRYGVEINAILNSSTREAYINKLPNATPQQRKLRGDLYDRVKGQQAVQPEEPKSPVDLIPNI